MTQDGRSAPLVSVVVTTFRDDPEKMRLAMDSILNQTLSNLELIIVFEKGDQNIDAFRAIVDERLVLLINPGEPNRSGCHNIGLDAARGRYIARMDGDDFSYPDRLERQVAFLRSSPRVAVVSAAGRLLDADGNFLGYRRFPETHAQIMRGFILTNPILHPACMWDRQRTGDIRYTLFDPKDPKFRVDDLDLWLQLIRQGARFHNMPDVLLDYRQPQNYHRPIKDRWGGLGVRLYHWRAGFQYPPFWFGILAWACILAMPASLINRVMSRNFLADRIRSIRTS